ncbi:MAG: patatin-like phospholipase family protein [Candidatus Omnitrophica bacterium]|nr:patatin-like phospholipase family protein [Candidatus Omnitrophota bacterium]
MKQKTLYHLLIIITCLSLSSGCAHLRHAVPENLVGTAVVAGMPDIRYYAGKPDSYSMMRQSLVDSFKEEGKSDYLVDGIKVYPALLIGGGVSNSAYGIGLLKGWLKEGTRPVFKIVTGYSSGSIIAIATFAGKDYEDRIAELFTSISSKDVLKKRSVFSVIFGDSVASSAPLAKKINDIVDEDLMAKITEEHRKGRRLYVGTTDFDAQGFVIWDMGALASKGGPESLKMFRKIILASCSFPVMVSPVYFQVEAGGSRFDEMHVDGGVVSGLFYIYQLMEGVESMGQASGINPGGFKTRLYVLNLCYMSPHSKQVEDNMVAMTSRLIELNGAAKMIGDTYRVYAYAKEKEWDYNLAYIPEDFKPNQKEMLDTQEMQRLFKRGYDDAIEGYKWHKAPPGLVAEGK